MKYLLMYLWQLPQNLAGLLYRDYLEYRDKLYMLNITEDFDVYAKDTQGSITLGRYIFLSARADDETILYEIGHVKQSKTLGPLYLLVIGLSSIL